MFARSGGISPHEAFALRMVEAWTVRAIIQWAKEKSMAFVLGEGPHFTFNVKGNTWKAGGHTWSGRTWSRRTEIEIGRTHGDRENRGERSGDHRAGEHREYLGLDVSTYRGVFSKSNVNKHCSSEQGSAIVLLPSGYVTKMYKSKFCLDKIHSVYKSDFCLTKIVFLYKNSG